MGSTAVVTLLLLLYFKISNQLAVENSDDVLKYHEQPLNIQKRETSSKHEYFNYIKQKLTEHSQALEQLVMFGLKHEKLIEKLVEYLIKDIEEPKLPEKLEVSTPINSRRSNTIDSKEEVPLVKFGNNMRRYGNLLKTLIVKEIDNDEEDPIPLVEKDPASKL